VALAIWQELTFGRRLHFPTPFDPRLIHRIPPALHVCRDELPDCRAGRSSMMDAYELSLEVAHGPDRRYPAGVNAVARAN